MIIAFCGPGRCGKDTAAEYWAKITGARFAGGCSYTVLPMIAKELGLFPEVAWSARHHNRQYWYDWCNRYRKDDPARIVRESLKHSDIICGVRDAAELAAAVAEGLIDLTVWIHRLDGTIDPTIKYSQYECDIAIWNDGTIEQFHQKLQRLANAMGVTGRGRAGAIERRSFGVGASMRDKPSVLAIEGLQGGGSDWPRGELRGVR